LFAEVVQLIAGKNYASFLTPDMASGYPTTDLFDAMSGIVFLTPCLASKSSSTLYPQSIAQLWQSSLHVKKGSLPLPTSLSNNLQLKTAISLIVLSTKD